MKSKILFLVFIIVAILWLRGGSYLRTDTSNTMVGREIFFIESMVKVKPIPDGIFGKLVASKFDSTIISTEFWDDGYYYSGVVATNVPSGSNYTIKAIIYENIYGFFESAFRTNSEYYLIEDKEKNESIFWEKNLVKIKN